MKIKIACLQMNSGNEVQENLRFVAQHLELAVAQGVQILQLPENFAQMPVTVAAQVVEEPESGDIQDFLSTMAARSKLTIIAGSVPIRPQSRSADKPHARCLVYGPDGRLTAHYNKIHLFDVELPGGGCFRESDSYTAGSSAPENHRVVKLNTTPKLLLGPSICYDLRFPELYRNFASQGVQLISVPSAFTFDTGKAHWQTLLQARAIENQAFVFAAAQTGTHANGRVTWGHSMIIDPWGEVLAAADDQPGMITATIDVAILDDLRARFPALQHRQL